MFCSRCGTQVDADAQFCPSCGQGMALDASPGANSAPRPSYVPRVVGEVRTGAWISAGWNMVTGDWLNYGLIALVTWAVNSVASIITHGPLSAGFHIVFMKRLAGRKPEVGDLFQGFNFFLPALLAGLVSGAFICVGFLLCIIPGLVLAAAYMFTYLFIVDKQMDFWPAMQASMALVKQNYMGFIGFLLAMIGINILGCLCCVVGLLVTVPLQYAAITVAYQELVGFEPGNLAAPGA